ncbi:MAG: aminotransferase class IV [Planctomycetes bacterium]|nr:aminotransferase class IV [Planctomycetota bacterium]
MKELVLFVDGRRLARGEAAIEADDLGVLQGIGVYETIRVDGGRPVWLEDHLRRFAEGLSRVGIDPQQVIGGVGSELRRSIAAACAAWGTEDAGSLRVTRTFGRDGRDGKTLLLVRPRDVLPPEVSVSVATRAKDPSDPLEGIKGTSRLRNFLLQREARAAGHYDCLVPTRDGDLSEGTICNLFVVVTGTVWTPTLDRGCLPGVTRDHVIQVMRRLSIPIRKAAVQVQHLLDAEEVFLTNSSNGALPVRAIAGLRDDLPGAAGPIVQKIQNRYLLDVERHLKDAAEDRAAAGGAVCDG